MVRNFSVGGSVVRECTSAYQKRQILGVGELA